MHSLGEVNMISRGVAFITKIEIFYTIVNIMDISKDSEALQLLHDWIKEIGIDEVYVRILRLHTTYHTE